MRGAMKRWVVLGIIVVAILVAGRQWWQKRQPQLPAGIAYGNGRIEADQVDITTKRAGRIEAVLVAEGDLVEVGQMMARMTVTDLQADLREAEANLRQAREEKRRASAMISQRESDLRRVAATIAQRESDLRYAIATIAQRESELALTKKEFERSQKLIDQQFIARQAFDEDRSKVETAEATLAQERARKQAAEAALAQEQAQKQSAEAALAGARIGVDGSQAAIEAAAARVERINSEIADSNLSSPIRGRVLYRLARQGEVLAAGGKVLTLVDLSDVYMEIFLPSAEAARVAIGADGRIVLDAAPQFVIPAAVSFVSPEAQFTPKQIETRSEREKLMFRIKVKIPRELVVKHIEQVKTGLRGVAYVRIDGKTPWPEGLKILAPESPQ